MTKGSLFLILAKKVLVSIEFNGSMYPQQKGINGIIHGWGDEALKALEKVKNEKEFIMMVDQFNKDHHNYEKEALVFKISRDLFNQYVDFTNLGEYKELFNAFSDWTFYKNLSNKDVIFTLEQSKYNVNYKATKTKYILKPLQTVRFHFGEVDKVDANKYFI